MPSPHSVQSHSRNEGVAHATSPSMGDSVGSWKHLVCTWSDSRPGIPPALELPSHGLLRPSALVWGSGCHHCLRTQEAANSPWDTAVSVLQFAVKLTFVWLLDSMSSQEAPCLKATLLGSELPGWRASLSICVDSIPFPPSLHDEKLLQHLWWKVLKVPNCNWKLL